MLPGIYPNRKQASVQVQWCLQLAAEDPLVLYSILAVSAAERLARSGQLQSGSLETNFSEEDCRNKIVPYFVDYKLNTIKLANEKMTVMQRAIEVSTVFAIMCLLSIDVITGNQKEMLTHVNGLQMLIAWRGGYHGLPPHVTEFILSTSYMVTFMNGMLPPAPPTALLPALPDSLVKAIQQDLKDDTKAMGTAVLSYQVSTLFDWKIEQAFRDLREYVQYREYYHEQQLPPRPDELECIDAKSYQLRYAVLSLPFESRPPTSVKQEPCRLALLIFWSAQNQVLRSNFAYYRNLTARLVAALQASDIKSLWDPYFELLVWVLSMGAYISAGQRERPWYVLNLLRTTILLAIEDWESMRAVLIRHFYVDRIFSQGMQELWDEVSLLADAVDVSTL